MTLILTLVTPEFVAQASDRRYTNAEGEPIEEQGNKTFVVACRDADLMLAFTGVVAVHDRLVYYQLLDYLNDLDITRRTLRHVVWQLRNWLTRVWNELPLPAELKHLTVTLVGWRRPGYQPFCVTISNAEDEGGQWLDSALPAFVARWATVQHGYYFQNNGHAQNGEAWTLFKFDALQDIKNLVVDDTHWNIIQDYLKEVIQDEANDPENKNRIGKICLACVLYRHDRSVVAQYYTPDPTDTVEYAPGLISDRDGDRMVIGYVKTDGIRVASPGGVTAVGSGDPSDRHLRILLPEYGLRAAPGLPRVRSR